MVNIIRVILPYIVLASHILLVVLFLSVLGQKTWGKKITDFLGKYSVQLGLVVSLGAVVGSLFYSQILGYEPCILCWWQRVLIYPEVIIFLIALFKKKQDVFEYIVPLSVLAGIIGLYQASASFVGFSITPCIAVGGACSRVYVSEFGYITIPVMSLTISLYILLLAWVKKTYRNEGRNA